MKKKRKANRKESKKPKVQPKVQPKVKPKAFTPVFTAIFSAAILFVLACLYFYALDRQKNCDFEEIVYVQNQRNFTA